MPPDLIARFLIRMAKFKTENKEFLSYLIYKAYDQQSFIEEIKEEINQQFKNLNKKNLYLSKKTIRKALKTTNKYIKFSGEKQTELELLIHFCKKMRASGLPLHHGKVLGNMYLREYNRVKKILGTLHEDLQYDYVDEIKKLS